MNKQELMNSMEACKASLVERLMEYVRDCGEDVTNHDREQFGLDCDEDENHIITRVLNLYDNGGCYFFQPDKVCDDSLRNMTDDDWSEQLYCHAVHTAYQCLYIVVNERGEEQLRYYRFTNGGLTWDDDQSEPDHGSAMMLPLLDLDYLLQAININF